MLRLFWSLLVLAGLHVVMISPGALFHLWTQLPLALKIGYVATSCVIFFILVGKILNEQLDSTDGYDEDCGMITIRRSRLRRHTDWFC